MNYKVFEEYDNEAKLNEILEFATKRGQTLQYASRIYIAERDDKSIAALVALKEIPCIDSVTSDENSNGVVVNKLLRIAESDLKSGGFKLMNYFIKKNNYPKISNMCKKNNLQHLEELHRLIKVL